MFDKKYYDDIWGTIHRHDYCEQLANSLIAKYGRVKILDIGTGCGELVRVLREKGCDAWGLEVSDYAIENSCAKEFVRKGDIRDIPFASGFDVVFSQGVWEYIPESDIQKAWKECQRVGKKQEHNIDFAGAGLGEEGFVTTKDQQWWESQLKLPKILLVCPVHESKEYSFQRYIDAIKKLTYPNLTILLVDNSPTEDFANKYREQIPITYSNIKGSRAKRVSQSMEYARTKFLEGNFSHMVTIEMDVIAPPNTIETLLRFKDIDYVSHLVPGRLVKEDMVNGWSCSLFSRKLIEEFDFASCPEDTFDVCSWWWLRIDKSHRYSTCELPNILSIQHLAEYE